ALSPVRSGAVSASARIPCWRVSCRRGSRRSRGPFPPPSREVPGRQYRRAASCRGSPVPRQLLLPFRPSIRLLAGCAVPCRQSQVDTTAVRIQAGREKHVMKSRYLWRIGRLVGGGHGYEEHGGGGGRAWADRLDRGAALGRAGAGGLGRLR